jgi:hypothetical protein
LAFRSSSIRSRNRKNVAQAHELDELEQLGGWIPQAQLAAAPTGDELEPRERVDGSGIHAHFSDRPRDRENLIGPKTDEFRQVLES